jgi:hypothetical protein
MKSIRLFLFCWALLISAQSFATCYGVNPQMCVNYVATPSVSFNDQTAYATTHNVWHTLSNPPVLTKIASGIYANDFATYGTDSAGNAWLYNDAMTGGDGTWTEQTSMGTDNLAFSIGGGVLARIRKSTTGCASGHSVDTWSGTAWVQKAGMCAQSISAAAQDGTLYAIELVSGVQKAYVYNGSVWSALTGGPYQSIAGYSNGIAYANDTTGGIWYRQNANGTTMVRFTTMTDQGTGPIFLDLNETLWKLFGNQMLRWNDTSGTWDRFVSNAFTAMTAGDPLHIFALTASGVYRFNYYSMSASVTVTGNSSCTPSPCQGNPLHTPKADMRFVNSINPSSPYRVVTGTPVPPPSDVNVTASDTTWDALSCAEFGEQGVCVEVGSGGGVVMCSQMGQIFGGAQLLPTRGGLYHVTHEKIDNNGTGCTTIRGDRWCNYSVFPACPNPPPYAFTNIQERGIDKVVALYWGWISYEACLTFPNATYTCLPVSASLGVGSDPGFRCDTPADVLAP